jgi:ABC-2 type transport system permease protein
VTMLRDLLPRSMRLTMLALGKRDLRRYFSNPTGYVFITLFILLSAAAAFWRPRFFLNSLANLDQLNEAFPYLLLFFVPALTMGLWADERKQGTDELLLTLPASEQAIVLGKYLAAIAIYTVALLVSLSHVVVLAWLGNPDVGLMTANYLGYWLVGVAVIPVAMLGSLLTGNVTIAFILGALLCASPIGISRAAATVSSGFGRQMEPISVFPYLADSARGIVSVEGILYFAGLAALFLYVNVIVLQRRHWRRETGEWPPALHAALRASAIALAIGSVVVLADRTNLRLDLTAARLYTLSSQTRELLASAPGDRAVIIQAFVSPEMPPALVQTRENLLGTLREIQARDGGTVTVTVQETLAYSDEARIARERFNILPRSIPDSTTGELVEDVYMGVAVASGVEEQVIPFFDPGLSPEYEVARAIRVVSRAERKRIGVLDTDIRILGGVDFRTRQPRPPWAAMQELRKQYDIVEVTPFNAPDTQIDALLMVLPSRMTQSELDLAIQPVKRGVPTVMIVDPLPAVDIRLAPAADLATEVNPFATAQASRIVYGDIRVALGEFGLNWVPARVAWDAFNPHPDLAEMPRENVFVAPGNGNPNAINRNNPATASLQEVLFLYPGYFLPMETQRVTVEPLLQTGEVSGASSFFDLVAPTPGGLVLNPFPSREEEDRQFVIAARSRSAQPLVRDPGARPINVLAIADIDFISDAFFEIRATAPTATFDNVSFFLNAIDLQAGDEAFIALRNRRVRHRTLARLEAQTRTFMEQRGKEEHQAQTEARTALEEARNRLKSRVDALNARTDLDAVSKQIMVRNLEETENRQLRVLEQNIAQARDAKVRASREAMEAQIRAIRTRIRALAVLLPPVPVLLIGLVLFVRRRQRERESARAMGRLREAG